MVKAKYSLVFGKDGVTSWSHGILIREGIRAIVEIGLKLREVEVREAKCQPVCYKRSLSGLLLDISRASARIRRMGGESFSTSDSHKIIQG